MGVEPGSEFELRLEAVRLVISKEMSTAGAARWAGRSREWLHKWLRRYRADSEAGLTDRSRAPREPARTDADTTAKVIEVRDRLAQHRYASVGGIAILAELERQGWLRLPSVATIERIVAAAGKTRKNQKQLRSGKRLGLPEVDLPGVWQQTDWIQDRFLTGGTRFQSLQIIDVGSQGMAADQYDRRKVRNTVRFLTGRAWPFLSIPAVITVDNAFCATTHPYNPFTEFVRLCLFFGTEVVVAPPGKHGWTNQAEAINNLWQQRVLRHHYQSLDHLKAANQDACHWFNHDRPVLDPTLCGTRYPAQHIANHHHQLCWLPDGFTIDGYLNKKNQLTLPLTAGQITYLRYITEQHTIHIGTQTWHLPETLPTASLVTATITTHNHQLTIRHLGETIATHPYPINQPIHQPHYPPRPHPLLSAMSRGP